MTAEISKKVFLQEIKSVLLSFSEYFYVCLSLRTYREKTNRSTGFVQIWGDYFRTFFFTKGEKKLFLLKNSSSLHTSSEK